jgi:hypothetical protein
MWMELLKLPDPTLHQTTASNQFEVLGIVFVYSPSWKNISFDAWLLWHHGAGGSTVPIRRGTHRPQDLLEVLLWVESLEI